MFWHFARVFLFYLSSAFSLIYIHVHVCKRIAHVQQGWDAKRQERIAFSFRVAISKSKKKNCQLKTKDKEKKKEQKCNTDNRT